MKKKSVHRPRYIGAKLIVGGALAAIGLICVLMYVKFEASAVHASGTIVELKNESHATGRKGGRVYITRPLVEFDNPTTKTHHQAIAKIASRNSDFARGQVIPIEFDPHNPEDTVRVEAGLSLLELGTLVAGLLLIAYALTQQLQYRRASRALAST